MTDRDLMKQALDAMLTVTDYDALHKAKLALRERLAHCDRCGKKLGGEGDIHTCTPKPEQEPVAWVRENELPLAPGNAFSWVETLLHKTPLYTTPPAAQRTWVELTDVERGKVYADWRWSDGRTSNLALCEHIEAKLKEKNNG